MFFLLVCSGIDAASSSCGFNQSGNLLTGQSVVDGIMGFGQSKLSIISQLYMQGLTPGIFAHCLQGSEKGGGVLVLGNVMDPQLVFTPIVSSQWVEILHLIKANYTSLLKAFTYYKVHDIN